MQQLATYGEALRRIDDARDAEAMRRQHTHRRALAPLLAQRDEHVRHVAGFWSGVLASQHTPLAAMMNGTIDPKVTAAVASVCVTTHVPDDDNDDSGGTLRRTVTLTLRPNLCTQAGSVSRTLDADGVTHALQPIVWKAGFDRARRDSLYRFFDADNSHDDDDTAFLLDALDAFDAVYQDPFLAMESD